MTDGEGLIRDLRNVLIDLDQEETSLTIEALDSFRAELNELAKEPGVNPRYRRILDRQVAVLSGLRGRIREQVSRL